MKLLWSRRLFEKSFTPLPSVGDKGSYLWAPAACYCCYCFIFRVFCFVLFCFFLFLYCSAIRETPSGAVHGISQLSRRYKDYCTTPCHSYCTWSVQVNSAFQSQMEWSGRWTLFLLLKYLLYPNQRNWWHEPVEACLLGRLTSKTWQH